jgi:thioredoxin-related protein
LMFGGNWCGWCHKLHDVFEQEADISKTLLYEYELVLIDTAAPNAEAVVARYKAIPEGAGVPYLTILDADGKLVANQATGPLEEGDHHVPAKVLAVLKEHQVEPLNAQAVLDDALAKARSSDKKVFLHFGAPWCGWCHKLEDFLAREDMQAILGSEFMDVKIDIDRMTGGQEILDRFSNSNSGGIPWFAFIDGEGKAVATSTGPNGNIGFPYAPEEIAHFMSMLSKSTKLTPEQLKAIETALTPKDAKASASR